MKPKDTAVGFLLAGVGESLNNPKWNTNFLIVDDGRLRSHHWFPEYRIAKIYAQYRFLSFLDTCLTDVEQYFAMLFRYPMIGVILVGTDLWPYIQPVYQKFTKTTLPMLLRINTKSSRTRPIRLKPCDTVTEKTEQQHRHSQ